MKQLANAVSVSFFFVFLVPSVVYLKTLNPYYLKLIAALIGGTATVELIKPLFGRRGIYARPDGAVGCDAFCVGGPVGGAPGFPSGHMMNIALFVGAMWDRSPYVRWIGLPWIAAMAWARWSKHCHNWQQIVAGTVLGFMLSLAL